MLFEVLQPCPVQYNISPDLFRVSQCGFDFFLSLNEVAETMARPWKNDEQWELRPICTYGVDKSTKISQIVMQKRRSLAALAYYSMSTFITAKNKTLFVHIMYIFGLDIVLDYVIKRLCDVITHTIQERKGLL